jgi:hypothetical protein
MSADRKSVSVPTMTAAEAAAWADRLADRLPNKMEMVGHSWSRRWDAYRAIIPWVLEGLGVIRPDTEERDTLAATLRAAGGLHNWDDADTIADAILARGFRLPAQELRP